MKLKTGRACQASCMLRPRGHHDRLLDTPLNSGASVYQRSCPSVRASITFQPFVTWSWPCPNSSIHGQSRALSIAHKKTLQHLGWYPQHLARFRLTICPHFSPLRGAQLLSVMGLPRTRSGCNKTASCSARLYQRDRRREQTPGFGHCSRNYFVRG